jgi:large subunit ribosomal protein L17
MRHGDKINNLGKKTAHRKAMMSNMACSLIEHKRITTTLAKAKALRVYAEPLITRSKVDSMHNRRIVFSYLQDKEAIKELFGTIGDKVAGRPGGYTRIIKLPRRLGDAADMALIELVDFNEIYKKETTEGAAKKTRRSRRAAGSSAAATTAVEAAPVAEEVVPVVEEAATPAVEETAAAPEAPATEENNESAEGKSEETNA